MRQGEQIRFSIRYWRDVGVSETGGLAVQRMKAHIPPYGWRAVPWDEAAYSAQENTSSTKSQLLRS